MDCPISRYRPSEQSYRPDPPPPQYDCRDQVRKVDACGRLSFRGRCFKIGKAFVGQQLGLRCSEVDGVIEVRFGEHPIGTLDL